jgi:actin-related protein
LKGKYYLTISWGKQYISEYFNSKGRASYFEKDEKEYTATTSDLRDFESKKKILIGNIIKSKQKPVINLQFIYNYLNQSKFN